MNRVKGSFIWWGEQGAAFELLNLANVAAAVMTKVEWRILRKVMWEGI